MSNAAAMHEPAEPGDEKARLVESLTEVVDDWRARIGELQVQADLAKLDVRELATTQLNIAQNACLAAASKLREARRDAAVSAQTLGENVRTLLEDVKEAFEAAGAVIARG